MISNNVYSMTIQTLRITWVLANVQCLTDMKFMSWTLSRVIFPTLYHIRKHEQNRFLSFISAFLVNSIYESIFSSDKEYTTHCLGIKVSHFSGFPFHRKKPIPKPVLAIVTTKMFSIFRIVKKIPKLYNKSFSGNLQR